MRLAVSVTVTEIREDGSAGPVDGELAAALAGPVGSSPRWQSGRRRMPAVSITASGRR